MKPPPDVLVLGFLLVLAAALAAVIVGAIGGWLFLLTRGAP